MAPELALSALYANLFHSSRLCVVLPFDGDLTHLHCPFADCRQPFARFFRNPPTIGNLLADLPDICRCAGTWPQDIYPRSNRRELGRREWAFVLSGGSLYGGNISSRRPSGTSQKFLGRPPDRREPLRRSSARLPTVGSFARTSRRASRRSGTFAKEIYEAPDAQEVFPDAPLNLPTVG